MKRFGWMLVLSALLPAASCTFKDTSKNEETRVSGENRESPPPAGVTENPGASQNEP